MNQLNVSLEEIKKKRLRNEDYKDTNDIAVIGIAGKIGSCNNIDEFWNLIRSGGCDVREIPEMRIKLADYYLEKTGYKMDYIKCAYLERIDEFDYNYFNLSANEASLMDPNHRILLETVDECLQNAGYAGTALNGSATGIFIGYNSDVPIEYKRMIFDEDIKKLSIASMGNIKSNMAGRISYIYNLKGPAILLDTACSSSLVAIIQACHMIQERKCNTAICGSVKINLLPIYMRETDMGVTSFEDKTRCFDNNANGFSGGEGCGVVLLKGLQDAIKDKDHIYAIIKGGCINNDGRTNSLASPNPNAQRNVINDAWKSADIKAETINYMEAHGTATQLGDVIEIKAMTDAFQQYISHNQKCAVGSVKANIGHLDCCAGMGSFIKVVLSIMHKMLPPQIWFDRPNRNINFIQSPFYINDRCANWEIVNGGKRRAGISAFGISGTNAHLIVDEYINFEDSNNREEKPEIFLLSANNEDTLTKYIRSWCVFLNQKTVDINLTDICYTLQSGRKIMPYRLAIICDSIDELKKQINLLDRHGIPENNDHIYYNKGKFGISGYSSETNAFVNTEYDLRKMVDKYMTEESVGWVKATINKKDANRMPLPLYPFDKKSCWYVPIDKMRKQKNYINKWIKTENDKRYIKEKKGETIAFLCNNSSFYQKIAEIDCSIQIKIGEVYCKTEKNKYTIVPNVEDISKLFTELSGRQIVKFLFFADSKAQNEIKTNTVYKNIFILLLLFQNLFLLNQKNISFYVIGKNTYAIDGSEKDLSPELAALYGFCKCVPYEYMDISCHFIDYGDSVSAEEIISEIYSGVPEFGIALRNSGRYVQKLVLLEEDNIKKITNIKRNGVYIITGGIGLIGTEIVKYFLKTENVSLILVGRTKYEPHRKDSSEKNKQIWETLKFVEKNGGEAEYYAADISSEQDVVNLYYKIKQKYKFINGVIHCAGLVGHDEMIKDMTTISLKSALRAKVDGTYLLSKQLKKEPLDFFVLCSSVITLMGGPGAAAYTAANSYLNAIHDEDDHIHYITINWPTWKESCKRLNKVYQEKNHLFKSLGNNDALYSFEKILKEGINNVYVGELNPESDIFNLMEFLPFNIDENLFPKRQLLNNISKDDKNMIESGKITRENVLYAWQQVLGIDEISFDDNFYELGGDSVLAVQLLRYLKGNINKELHIADIYSYPTINLMTSYIEDEIVEADYLDSILNKLSRGEIRTDEINW